MKLCKNCRHFSGTMFCRSPQNGVSMIDGSANPEFAIVSRNDDRKCGPNAVYWQQKEIAEAAQTIWSKIHAFWIMKDRK